MTIIQLFRLLFISPNPWHPAWIRDEAGEVFPAQYRIEGGRVIVKTQTGRMVEGRHDGTTSKEQIAHWWPAGSSADYIQWVAASVPSVGRAPSASV